MGSPRTRSFRKGRRSTSPPWTRAPSRSRTRGSRPAARPRRPPRPRRRRHRPHRRRRRVALVGGYRERDLRRGAGLGQRARERRLPDRGPDHQRPRRDRGHRVDRRVEWRESHRRRRRVALVGGYRERDLRRGAGLGQRAGERRLPDRGSDHQRPGGNGGDQFDRRPGPHPVALRRAPPRSGCRRLVECNARGFGLQLRRRPVPGRAGLGLPDVRSSSRSSTTSTSRARARRRTRRAPAPTRPAPRSTSPSRRCAM